MQPFTRHETPRPPPDVVLRRESRRSRGSQVAGARLRLYRLATRFAPLILATAIPIAAHAATLPLQGVFLDDDEIFSISFTLPAPDNIAATSLGFAGGIDANGVAVPAGGFATVLSLFDTTGQLVQLAVGSANSCAAAPVDPAGGFRWDACFTAAVGAGSYTLVLSQDGNVPYGPSLSDGFSMTGQHDFTGLNYLGTSARFINADGSQRDGHWAMTVSASAVPEPAPWVIFPTGLALLGVLVRRHRADPLSSTSSGEKS